MQEFHFLLLIITFALQLTTLIFVFFDEKINFCNKPEVKYFYRFFAMTASILGTFYFCTEETGFCAKTPLYYFFLDNSANDHKQQRDYIYSKVAVVFIVLVLSMQAAIEWKKIKFNNADKLANMTANLARHRIEFAYSMMMSQNRNTNSLSKNATVFQSSPNLLDDCEEKKMTASGNEQLSFHNLAFHDEFAVSLNKIIIVIPLEYNHRETIEHDFKEQMKEEKTILRRVQSCPNLQSSKNERKEDKNNFPTKSYASKVMKVTRAISSFIVIPTVLILSNNLVSITKPFGGCSLKVRQVYK